MHRGGHMGPHHGPPGPGPHHGPPGPHHGPPGPGFHPGPPGPHHCPPGPGFHPGPPGPHHPPPGPGFHPGPHHPPPGFHPGPPGFMPGPPPPGFVPGPPPPGFVPGPPPGGFPGGYPVFRGQLGPNMYFKPIWSPKREAKLNRVWFDICRCGRITYVEIQRLLAAFHYMVTPYEAQWFLNSLDRNRDGRIDLVEVRVAMQQFVMTYPRTRNPAKMHLNKPWYRPGYNWRAHPGFPGQYGHLWTF